MRTWPTPGCSFVARVAFDLEGLPFQPGDPFPYQDFGWTEDAAWNFWRSAMIEVAPAPVAVPAVLRLPVKSASRAAKR